MALSLGEQLVPVSELPLSSAVMLVLLLFELPAF
jgi:hypothetical protein